MSTGLPAGRSVRDPTLAYFADGDRYTYGSDPEADLLCVGWLDPAHPFNTGETPDGFSQLLADMCRQGTNRTRGFHRCEFCPPPADGLGFSERPSIDGVALGSAEIRVHGGDATWAAPDLIIHYVLDHAYLPPQPFIDAVFASDPNT